MESDRFVKQESQEQVYIVNPADRCAIQEALSIRKRAGEGTITVVTVGPDRTRQALYYCLAHGADEAIHISYDDDTILDS